MAGRSYTVRYTRVRGPHMGQVDELTGVLPLFQYVVPNIYAVLNPLRVLKVVCWCPARDRSTTAGAPQRPLRWTASAHHAGPHLPTSTYPIAEFTPSMVANLLAQVRREDPQAVVSPPHFGGHPGLVAPPMPFPNATWEAEVQTPGSGWHTAAAAALVHNTSTPATLAPWVTQALAMAPAQHPGYWRTVVLDPSNPANGLVANGPMPPADHEPPHGGGVPPETGGPAVDPPPDEDDHGGPADPPPGAPPRPRRTRRVASLSSLGPYRSRRTRRPAALAAQQSIAANYRDRVYAPFTHIFGAI